MGEYMNEIKDIWDTHWMTNMGVKHRELQEKLKDYLRVDQIDLFTNGHMALELSLQAMDFSKGGEVITTPFTFASTTHAIVRNDLIPVFCDINPDDFTMDVTKIESLITDRTVAIMPVHVYGNVCQVEEIQKIGATRNEVFNALERNEIGARKYFYPLTNSFECYRGRFDSEETPAALHISKRVLTLPLYADLDLEDVDRICKVIRGMQM